MKKIVECIPNFSEGRDRDKIELIVKTITAVPRVAALDYSMDSDHNRSVITSRASRRRWSKPLSGPPPSR